ncbi:hypothetical protein CsatA_028422 [Cannabis sativa]
MDPTFVENPPRPSGQNQGPQHQNATLQNNWNPFQNSLNSSLTVKLDRSNFLAWKSQVIPTVIGHGLDDILLAGVAPQERMVNGQENPMFLAWKRKDQLLLSWLRSSMSESILGSVAHHVTSSSAWRALEQRFASQSKARLLQIKSQLSTVQKGSLSIADYFDKVKILADSLSTAGHPLDESDLIMHLLNGLGPEYDPVVVHVTSLVDNLSFDSIQSLLLTHESRLERHYTTGAPLSGLSANLSVGSSRFGAGSTNNRSAGYGGRGYGAGYSNRPFNRGHGSGGRSHGNPRTICQVCHKSGHTAAVCHYRFDKSFVPPKLGESQAFLTEMDEEDQNHYSSHTIPDFAYDQEWYADTGANSHVAKGMEHLDYEAPYPGQETLAVGNGKQLPISHIGQEHRESFAQRES